MKMVIATTLPTYHFQLDLPPSTFLNYLVRSTKRNDKNIAHSARKRHRNNDNDYCYCLIPN